MSEEKILPPEQNYGPGNVLRSKREEYEWSIDAVAEALHLSTSSVKAIEADRYDDLPGATYVMGYWRSYARLLGIDIEDTIEANKQNLNIVTAEASGMDINRAFGHQKRTGAGSLILILIILVAFGYFAWQPPRLFGLLENLQTTEESGPNETQPETKPEAVAGEDSAQLEIPVTEQNQVLRPLKKAQPDAADSAAATPSKGSTDLLASQSAIPESNSSLILQTVDDTGNSKAESATNTVADGQTDLVLSQDASIITATEGGDSEPTDTAEKPIETEAEVSAESTADATREQAAPANETVTFKVTKDTWLDVRDKDQTRLFYKTAKAGAEVQVSGVPPFYVLVQPPDGATVHYKGKEFPFEPHKNGLYARFKLDEQLKSL